MVGTLLEKNGTLLEKHGTLLENDNFMLKFRSKYGGKTSDLNGYFRGVASTLFSWVFGPKS
jgi:hypothetical protein